MTIGHVVQGGQSGQGGQDCHGSQDGHFNQVGPSAWSRRVMYCSFVHNSKVAVSE